MLHPAIVGNEKNTREITRSYLEKYSGKRTFPIRVFDNGYDFLEGHTKSFDATLLALLVFSLFSDMIREKKKAVQL